MPEQTDVIDIHSLQMAFEKTTYGRLAACLVGTVIGPGNIDCWKRCGPLPSHPTQTEFVNSDVSPALASCQSVTALTCQGRAVCVEFRSQAAADAFRDHVAGQMDLEANFGAQSQDKDVESLKVQFDNKVVVEFTNRVSAITFCNLLERFLKSRLIS